MKGRQSAAAAISVSQLLLVIAYLCVIGGIEIMKCFKKQQEKRLVLNLELMEAVYRREKARGGLQAGHRRNSNSDQLELKLSK